MPDEYFISEPLTPEPGTPMASTMAIGEAGLPRRFVWRDETYEVEAVLRHWKSSGREGHSKSGELYLRRHWWKIRTIDGTVMTVYCERQARSHAARKRRWFVYTVEGD